MRESEEGEVDHSLSIFFKERDKNKFKGGGENNLSRYDFSWEGRDALPKKWLETFTGAIRSITVKENHFGLAIS